MSAAVSSRARREAIREALARRSGGVDEASAVAKAARATWAEVVTQLSPVIGNRGVDVLFQRALHLTTSTFAWLASGSGEARGASQMAGLGARLESRDAAAAMAATLALFCTFTDLLASLIGEPLTERLLGPVWRAGTTAVEAETRS